MKGEETIFPKNLPAKGALIKLAQAHEWSDEDSSLEAVAVISHYSLNCCGQFPELFLWLWERDFGKGKAQ